MSWPHQPRYAVGLQRVLPGGPVLPVRVRYQNYYVMPFTHLSKGIFDCLSTRRGGAKVPHSRSWVARHALHRDAAVKR